MQNNPLLMPTNEREWMSNGLRSDAAVGAATVDVVRENEARTPAARTTDERMSTSQRHAPLSATPHILLTATLRWPIAARLAIAFAEMGCSVDAICPQQHPVTKTRAVRQRHPYSALKPLVALRAAIESSAPDLIVPCDDNAAIHLHRLYLLACETGAPMEKLRVLIARSLGNPEACTLASARGQFMALAAEEGVRIPETTVVAAPSDLNAWRTRHKFPAVIKIDCTWGGQGVSIVRNHEEAQCVFGLMASRPSLMNAVARTLLDRDPTAVLNALQDARRTVTLQDFISGTPANRAVACWQGEVLAGISVQAIRTQHTTGPATVVRVIENPEMSDAVNRLVRRLGISGLWGIDFVLESATGAAYVIEMNPRATPICHLPLGAGHNLPAALYTQLTGIAPRALPTTIADDTIAMFPGEWQRDPTSGFLRSAYHDIPWEEPALMQECIGKPWSERGLLARLWAQVRPKAPQPQWPTASFVATELAALQRNDLLTEEPGIQAQEQNPNDQAGS